MWEKFVEYNLIRTNFLKIFVEKHIKAGDSLLPLFFQTYKETGSLFKAYIEYSYFKENQIDIGYYLNSSISTEDIKERLLDYKENWWLDKNINKYLKEMFPEMISSGYDIRNMEKDVDSFSPLSIEEFYKISKGKGYLGQDLDEDLFPMIPYVREQDLILKFEKEISEYFKFRYDNFDLTLLCEYASIPFGYHESRAERYRKTGEIEFDLPREVKNYPVEEIVNNNLKRENLEGTRIINIRGTNGSGKTTMVTNIFQDSFEKGYHEEKEFMLTSRDGKTRRRFYDVLKDKKILLLGGYDSPYGTKGTDRLGDVYEILQGILFLVNDYPGWTIIMESATVSTSFWAYALLFMILKEKGATINIITLIMKDWDFVVNNVKNRTKRKEGQKEPDYEGILNKRFILYKNHFRFSSILGFDSVMFMYPDEYLKEEMHIGLNNIVLNKTERGLL